MSTESNQLLVWDRYAGNWIGTWEGAIVEPVIMFTYKEGELERLAYVGSDGIAYRMLVDGCTDDDGTHEGMVFETSVDIGDQDAPATEVALTLDSHYGAWATFAQADGVGEGVGPLQVAPDPSKYRTFGTPDYDMTNDNNDQLAPNREDYGTVVYTGDEDNIPHGGVYVDETDGLTFGARQAWAQRVRMRKPFKSLTITVQSMRGWIAVRKVAARMRRKAFGRGRKT